MSAHVPPTTDSPAVPDLPEAVRRVQRGDVAAFEVVYRANVDRVYALCLRMCGDSEAARERTQDVFIRCWERIGSFRGESAFSTWLHRVAVNVVLEASRSTKRRLARVEPTADVDAIGGRMRESSPELRMDFEAAVRGLPPGARRAYVLHEIEGYKHHEIARLTGTAAGTVRAQLHRARRLLMEALS